MHKLFYMLDFVKEKMFLNASVAGVAQLVEHHLAKVDVEGSNPFARSKLLSENFINRR